MSSTSETDFWWIEEERQHSLYVGVGHSKPSTEDQLASIEDGGFYPLRSIRQWRNACSDINVYRTLTLFDKDQKPILLGPFLIDIDNSEWLNGYQEDLGNALEVAQTTIRLLETWLAIQEKDLRVFFSGHKGFNIEVRPSSLGIKIDDTVADQIKLSRRKLDNIIKALRDINNVTCATMNKVTDEGTVIDRIYGSKFNEDELKYPYIRLHNSINKWIQKDGSKMARIKIGLSLPDLSSMSAEQICHRARCDV